MAETSWIRQNGGLLDGPTADWDDPRVIERRNEDSKPPAEMTARPRQTTSRRPQNPKRQVLIRLSIVLATFVSVAVIAAAWLAFKANHIKSELEAATGLIHELKADIIDGRSSEAQATFSKLQAHTDAAVESGQDPVWTLASALPWLGPDFSAVSEITRTASDVTRLGLGSIMQSTGALEWADLLPGSKRANLGPIKKAAPDVRAAALAFRESRDRLERIDAATLLPQISAPLKDTRKQLQEATRVLDVAADAATLAPSMMGSEAPRHYLLLIQNNAEARATGGIPGALAVLDVNNGKLTLSGQASATELGTMSPRIPIESEEQQIYSGRIGKFMQDVNLTPNFPSSAATARAMWEQKTGKSLDGVVSIDPVALSYLLESTGPINLQNSTVEALGSGQLPTRLTSSNVVKTLLSDVYKVIPEPASQDIYFASTAKQIFAALSAGKDSKKLVGGITRGVEEGRILVWSSSPTEQSVLSKYALSGSVSGPAISPAQFGVYFNDGTGAKMDYYVKRSVQLFRECTNDGYSQVKVRVKSTNTAPADAADSLPAYVTGAGAFGVPAGTVRTNITSYGPIQSQVETAVADGKKIGFASKTHSGRPVGTVTVELPPGKSSIVEFTFGKIVQHTEPQLSVTPTVQATKDVVLNTISEKCVPVP